MHWAQIRFTVSTSGEYATYWVRFRTTLMREAVYLADALATGYTIGCSLTASIDQIQTMSPSKDIDVFDAFDDPIPLHNLLRRYREKG